MGKRSSRFLVSAAVCFGSAQASAATLPFDGSPVQEFVGPAISQRFLTDDVSVVRSPAGAACVLSATIDIERSRYVAKGPGPDVPFAEITRSRATSVQIIAPVDGAPETIRVQLKYPIEAAAPMFLRVGGRAYAVRAFLEASGDSLRITDPALIAALRPRLSAGDDVKLVASSLDTGHRVEDRIPPVDLAPLDDCLASEPARAAQALEPSTHISLSFSADPATAPHATPQEVRVCGITDPATTVYRGTIRETTGFFSQTRDVFVSYDPDGRISQVHIPGIYEARSGRDGIYDGDVSIAANSNDPMAPNAVKGCLGAAPMPVCAYDTGAAGPDDVTRLDACVGELLSGDLPENAAFLSDFDIAGARTPRGPGTIAFPRSTRFPFTGGGGGGGFGGGGGSSTPRTPVFEPPTPTGGDEESPPPPLSVVPAPASLGLLASGLIILGLVGPLVARRRRASDCA